MADFLQIVLGEFDLRDRVREIHPRRVLNDHGLYITMAIVNYIKMYLLYNIPQEELELARKLVFRDESTGDPLQVYMARSAGMKGKPATSTSAHLDTLSVEDKLKFAIINGEKSVGDGANKKTLEVLLEDALASCSPLESITRCCLTA